MYKPTFAILVLFCIILPVVTAAPVKITSGSVSFLATGKPGFLKINGTGPEVRGMLDSSPKLMTGELIVTMDKFNTGIDLRDEHMKEKYFEVKKFPEASLMIKELVLDDKGQASDAPFKGTLSFHGIQRDIAGTATVISKGAKQQVEAEFPMALKDFNIDIPSYAGVKVADTVVVKAKIEGAP